jgi:hypothetical protein
MTNEQIVSRCENCGGLKREHRRRGGALKCPTRLKDSEWKPWTVEGYQAAEDAGKLASEEMRARHEPMRLAAAKAAEERNAEIEQIVRAGIERLSNGSWRVTLRKRLPEQGGEQDYMLDVPSGLDDAVEELRAMLPLVPREEQFD